jgi:hypothetical protein
VMTLYIGVDIRARQQTLSYLDTADGTIGQVEGQEPSRVRSKGE